MHKDDKDLQPPVSAQELREIADLLSRVPRSGAASRRQLDQAALKLRTWANALPAPPDLERHHE